MSSEAKVNYGWAYFASRQVETGVYWKLFVAKDASVSVQYKDK